MSSKLTKSQAEGWVRIFRVYGMLAWLIANWLTISYLRNCHGHFYLFSLSIACAVILLMADVVAVMFVVGNTIMADVLREEFSLAFMDLLMTMYAILVETMVVTLFASVNFVEAVGVFIAEAEPESHTCCSVCLTLWALFYVSLTAFNLVLLPMTVRNRFLSDPVRNWLDIRGRRLSAKDGRRTPMITV